MISVNRRTFVRRFIFLFGWQKMLAEAGKFCCLSWRKFLNFPADYAMMIHDYKQVTSAVCRSADRGPRPAFGLKGRVERVRATGEMVLREIAGEYLLIPTGETALKIHGMVTLSESGLLLWKKLQTECTEEALVEALLAEYEVDRETAQADVQDFLGQLDKAGLLI